LDDADQLVESDSDDLDAFTWHEKSPKVSEDTRKSEAASVLTVCEPGVDVTSEATIPDVRMQRAISAPKKRGNKDSAKEVRSIKGKLLRRGCV